MRFYELGNISILNKSDISIVA